MSFLLYLICSDLFESVNKQLRLFWLRIWLYIPVQIYFILIRYFFQKICIKYQFFLFTSFAHDFCIKCTAYASRSPITWLSLTRQFNWDCYYTSLIFLDKNDIVTSLYFPFIFIFYTGHESITTQSNVWLVTNEWLKQKLFIIQRYTT